MNIIHVTPFNNIGTDAQIDSSVANAIYTALGAVPPSPIGTVASIAIPNFDGGTDDVIVLSDAKTIMATFLDATRNAWGSNPLRPLTGAALIAQYTRVE